MPITIRIPTPLRRITGGAAKVESQGATIRESLDYLIALFPELGERIYDENHEPRRFVNLFVDGEDIRFLSGLETAVTDGAEVSIVPAVAGG